MERAPRSPLLLRILLRRSWLALVGVMALASGARANHYLGGSITYDCQGGNNYLITLDLFLDCSGTAIVPQTLSVVSDCGTSFVINNLVPPAGQEVSQLCPSSLPNSTCNGGALPGVMHYQITQLLNLPPCNNWTFSWNICCRGTAVDLAGAQGIYIESTLDNTGGLCDDSPVFTDQSLPYVCVNQEVNYNFGVTDPDGDQLVYSLVNAQFYTGVTSMDVTYSGGYTGATPVPGIVLDQNSGQLTFTPTISGRYVMVLQVDSYDASGHYIGSVMRDIVFVVIPCTGNAPVAATVPTVTGPNAVLTGQYAIEVCDGSPFCFDMPFSDADAATTLQVQSQVTALLPGSTFNVVGTNPAVAHICWTGDVNNSPVNVLIEANDGACPVVNTASVGINIVSVNPGGGPPDPGTNGSIQLCGTAAPISLFAQLGGTPDPGGTWLDPSGVPHSDLFTPSTDVGGVYTYRAGNACAYATSTVTVTLTAPPSAGTNGTLTICSNAAAVSLISRLGGSPTAGGAWTGPSAVVGGNYDPATMNPGVYTYTITGTCAPVSATVTVTERASANAGTNGTLTVCSNGATASMFAQLGGGPTAGGTWTGPSAVAGGNYNPVTMNPGVYTYTVTGTAPCPNATATVTVTENAPPVAGTNGTLTICSDGAAVSLITRLGGAPAAGGAWTGPSAVVGGNYDPATMNPGVYTYTVTGTAPCANATATVTVTENAAPNAGTNGALSICSNGAAVGLFAQLGGTPTAGGTWAGPSPVVGGNYNPATMNPGNYVYTVTGTAPCVNATATVVVTENAPPNAGTNGTLTVCSNSVAASLFAQLGGAPAAGGAWSGPSAVVGGNYDPATMNPGVYTYTVTGTAPCANATATVTVTENAPPDAGTNGALSVCNNGAAASLFAQLGGTPAAGGAWSGPSAVVGGNYDPATMNPGNYVYTVTGAAPCANATATIVVTENAPPNAGTNGTLTVCGNSAAASLFAQLGGAPAAGGAWSGPSAVVGGNYDPATMNAGVYTYTVTGTAPCANATATVTVTENAPPNAGTNGTLTVCANGASASLFTQLGGAPAAGGAWSGPSAVVGGNYDPVTMTAGVYTYTVTGTAPCANATATVTVTENAPPDAGTNGTLTICGNDVATSLFNQLGGAPTAGGAWSGPSAVVGGNYDPATMTAGVYTYTVSGTAQCANATATVTVTENAPPNAGTNGTLTVCANGASASLFAQLGGGPAAGGAWSGPSAVVGGNYDPATMNAGVYTYTVTGTAPCANATATVTVTENAPPDAGTNGTLTICGNDAATSLFNQLGGAPAAGGAWSGPSAVVGGNYDPATMNAGVYTYTVTGTAPCANATATVTVTENAPPNAGTNGTLTVCANGASASLFAQLGGGPDAGGAWSGPSAVVGGNYDPATMTAGVYTYTVTGTAPCANATATVTVTENAPPDAGTNSTLTICGNDAATSLFNQLGGAPTAGGAWSGPSAVVGGNYDPATMNAGVYTYTVTGTAPCVNATATVTVTENAPPNAGTNGTLTVCANGASASLFTQLGGAPAAGGAWSGPSAVVGGNYDPATMNAGVYTYTVTGTAPCANATATVTVTENAPPDAGTNGTLTICGNDAATSLFNQLGGAPAAGGAWSGPSAVVGGNYDPTTMTAGVYTYTVSGTAPCANAAATVTVTENAPANAGADATTTLCSTSVPSNLLVLLTGAQAGGTWTGPSGAFSGTYDPATDGPGIYTYTVTGAAPCTNDQATVTVTENAAANAGADGTLTICDDGAATALLPLLTGAQAGGTWTGPSGAFSGTYDPATDGPAVYTYTVTGVAPCANDQATVTVTEHAAPHAGADGVLAICSNGVATNLFGLLTGADASGTWTGPSGAFSGTYDPAFDASGVFTYTVTGVAPCANDQATVTVTENPVPNAGTNGTLTICSNNAAASLFAQLGGAPAAGGSWSGPSAVVGGNYDPATMNAGVYTYTVTGTAPCANATATVTVTENTAPTAGADATLTTCSNAATTNLFTLLTGAQAGGAWTDPSNNASSGTYDPTTDGPGVYTYTVTGAAPCAADAATVTVTENAAPNAGADAVLNICSGAAATNLFPLLTGAQAGGSWTTGAGLPFSGTYDPAVNSSGTFNYQVTGGAPCGNDQATVTVTENGAADAGTNGTLNICSDQAAVSLFAQLGGTPQTGGAWSGPSAVVGGQYDPTTMAQGVYTYTITGVAPCVNASATVTVTEHTAPQAGTDGALSVCDQGGAVALGSALTGADPGGTWNGPSAVVGGSYDPATMTPGIYTYTVNGTAPCAADQASVNVSETSTPNAGANATLTVCKSDAAMDLFNSLTGADAGGTWTGPTGLAHSAIVDPFSDQAGVYTYTIAAVPPCAGDAATVTVTINTPPVAGPDGALTVCDQGGAVALANSLTGEDPGGTWSGPSAVVGGNYDPATMNPGIYTYTLLAVAPCANDQATVTVTETSTPNAGTDGSATLCASGASINLFTRLTGADAGGTWTGPTNLAHSATLDPSVDVSGVYHYTIAAVAPCAGDASTVTVTINPAPNAGADGTLTVCDQAGPVALINSLTGAQAGGSWSGPSAVVGGQYDPATMDPGVYTYTVTGTAPCGNDQATVTVTETSSPNAGTGGNVTVCASGAPVSLFSFLTGADAGGFWTDPGGNLHSPTFTPGGDGAGTYTYTISAVAPCSGDVSTVTITINPAPNAGTDGTLTVCDQGGPVALINSLTGAQAGGSWSGPSAVVGGNYDPATMDPGVYTYTVVGSVPCTNDQATVTVSETSTPNAGTDGSITLCSSGASIDLFAQLTGADAGGTWTGPTNVGHSATLDPAVDAAGVYHYTIAAVAPCTGDVSTVTVTINTAANAGTDGTLTVCDQGGAVALINSLTGAQAGGSWTGPSAVVGGQYDPATMNAGVYTYTVTGAAPCANDQATVTVSETSTPNAGTDGSITLCSSGASINLFAQLTGADAGGTWTGPTNVAHSATLDPAVDAAGVYHYTIAAVAPCTGDASTVTVTINTAANAGTDGTLTVCDQGGAVALINSLTGAQAGGSWTGPSVVVGGQYDPATMNAGVYTYTVTGDAPCANDQATVTVSETSTPNAGTDGSVTLCANGVPIDLFSELTGADAGGTWTGPTNLPHSATVDPSTDAAGVYTYTIAAVAPCAGDASTVTVAINAAPNAGIDGTLTVCDQGGAVALINSLAGAQAGGSWSGPSAVVGGNYDPATMGPGAYTYTVTGAAPCGNDQATVTVSETSTPNAGGDGDVTLCANSVPIDLFGELSGADAGGTWTGPDGLAHSATLDPAVDGSGIYQYTIAAVAPCAGDASHVLVTINAAPNAGTDGTLTVCDQGGAVALINSLTGAQAGGSWTGPSTVTGGNYDPATMDPGVYVYTVTGAPPCGSDQATVTVSETSSPDAGADGSTTVCGTGVPFDLFALLTNADAGGTWTDPSNTLHSATFTPGTDAGGVYTYSIAAVAPCAGDQATVTVTVEQQANAGTNGSTAVCTGDAPFGLITVLGSSPDAGGTWTDASGDPFSGTFDPASSTAGTYTYTIGSAVCAQVSATATVSIAPGPNAGQDNSVAYCDQGPAVDLFSELNGTPDAGGTWAGPDGLPVDPTFDPASSAPGDYTYTVPSSSTCPDAHATVTVVVNSPPNAGSIGIATLCSDGDPVDLFSELGGSPDAGGTWTGPDGLSATGTFDPASDAQGVYTYTVAGIAPCPSASASITVEVQHAPDAGTDAHSAFCASGVPVGLLSLLGGAPDVGGTWTGPDGAVPSGQFDPATSAAGVYTYVLEAVVPCVADQSAVTIDVAQPVDAGDDGSITLCSDHTPVALFPLLLGTPSTGGSWTAPDGTPNTGDLDPSTLLSGDYTYTVTAISPCPQDQALVHVDILPAPHAQILSEVAAGCSPVQVVFSSTYAGGGSCHWDFGNGETSNDCSPLTVTYDTTGTFAVTLTIDPGNGCITTFTEEGGVEVFGLPEAEFVPLDGHLNAADPLVGFVNQSTGASRFAWDFAGLGGSTEVHPSFTFPHDQEAVYTICLIAYASPTCADTVCHDLFIPLAASINVPNAFTPDGDGINDRFSPVMEGVDPDAYQFYIFDRWGKAIFSTQRLEDQWDGSVDGTVAQIGVYVWKVIGKDMRTNDRFERIGHVTLVR